MKRNLKIQIGIAIGLMCLLLTGAIVIQLNTIKEATKIVGTQYAETGLKEEVIKWKEDYERLYRELEEKQNNLEIVRKEATKDNGRTKQLQEDLDNTNRLLGLTEVTGSGIILTLSDQDRTKLKETGGDPSQAIVHAEDLIQIINELKNSGAEAISVNGQRIMSTTAITCSGTIITINGVKVNSPFEIRVLGNYFTLTAIARPGGYLSLMEDGGVKAKLEKQSNIVIQKYTGTITPKYMIHVK